MIGSYVNEVLTFAGDTVLTDIYGNMNANPEYAMPSRIKLQLISPCINYNFIPMGLFLISELFIRTTFYLWVR